MAIGDILDVVPGAKNLGSSLLAAQSHPYQVVGKSQVVKEGLFNPYTTSGHILVQSVSASCHSEWILDPLLDKLGASRYIPRLY